MFIVVCPNTIVSKLVYDWIAGQEVETPDGRTVLRPGKLELLSNMEDGQWVARPRTILIDSAQLESGEVMKQDFKDVAAREIAVYKAEYRRRDPAADVDKLTDEDLLREVMNTVGKRGRLGEQVRAVVSVSMLTEGWDTNTVSHILGIRRFGSQLLCEQVVGRGLRRRSYAPNEQGRFEPGVRRGVRRPFRLSSQRTVDHPDARTFEQTILDNLRAAGVQNGRKAERLTFSDVEPLRRPAHPGRGRPSHARRRFRGIDTYPGGCLHRPQYGTVSAGFVKDAAREATKAADLDLLCVLGFAFDPQVLGVTEEFAATDESFDVAAERSLGRVPVLLVRMNADLVMGEDLKKTGARNLFTVFGEPDIEVTTTDDGQLVVEVRGVDVYDPTTGEVRSSGTDQVALWMIDTDYDEESFFVRHCYFTGGQDPYKRLKQALEADIDEDAGRRSTGRSPGPSRGPRPARSRSRSSTTTGTRWSRSSSRDAHCRSLGRSPRHDGGVTIASVPVLERPVYGVVEAAGYLGLRSDRVRAWLDGYDRAGIVYAPVVRDVHTGSDVVTWGEFVELGYLREYRRKGVSLQKLRPVIEALRREFATPYPLATARPFVMGKELVLELQEKNDLPSAIAIVVRSGQTVALTPEARRFFQKVEFDAAASGGAARRLRPAGPASPVVIDPLVRFGRPNVGGVATERLWELHDAGETVDEIVEGYDLAPESVRAAIAYEEQQRSLAA